jgi:deoxyribose-phosphate aldolase
MKYIEYASYDIDTDENEIKLNIEKIKNFNINYVSVPYFYTKLCKTILKDTNIKVSNSIDYPFGISDTKTRNSAVLNAINNGAQKIELVFPNNLLANRKYDKIKTDIKTNKQICDDNNIELFFYLEYRIFTHQSLIKACNILKENDINFVYPSTGYMLDNIDDNIIATILLNQKSNITTIFSGNAWNKDHFSKLKKHDISFIRINTLNIIEDLIGYFNSK